MSRSRLRELSESFSCIEVEALFESALALGIWRHSLALTDLLLQLGAERVRLGDLLGSHDS